MPQPTPPHTFPRYFKYTLSTKRGGGTGTRRTAPIAHLTEVRCGPIIPLDPTEQQETLARGVSADCQVFCDPADVLPEDVVAVAGGTEYSAVEVSLWPTTDPRVMHITLRKYQG